jgi:hypothetical protein
MVPMFLTLAHGNRSNPDEPIDAITIEFTHVVLAIGVFAVGVERLERLEELVLSTRSRHGFIGLGTSPFIIVLLTFNY